MHAANIGRHVDEPCTLVLIRQFGWSSKAESTPVTDPTPDLPSPDSLVDLSTAAEQAALDFALEDCWIPNRLLQHTLRTVHDVTGLDWWASIAATTASLRLATFPVMLMQIKNTYRLSACRAEIEPILNHMKEEQNQGNPNAVAEYQQRVWAVYKKHGANPLKSLATLFVQAPVFIGMFTALRALATAKVPSLTHGGMLWFTDLTVPDPYYALPVLASATFLATVELGAADGMEGQAEDMKKKMKNLMRVVAVAIVPFTLSMPAGVFMYWTTSNIFSLTQTLVFKVPGVKKALGIPVHRVAGGKGIGTMSTQTIGQPPVTFAQKPNKK